MRKRHIPPRVLVPRQARFFFNPQDDYAKP